MTFHDTLGLPPDQLRDAITQAKRQEDAVLCIFQRLRKPLTPSEVHRLTTAAGKKWPIGSIRRAVTDLADERGALVKLDTLRPGPLGKPEHQWIVAHVEQSMPLPNAIHTQCSDTVEL